MLVSKNFALEFFLKEYTSSMNILRRPKKLTPWRINYLLKVTGLLKRKPFIYIFKLYSIYRTKN